MMEDLEKEVDEANLAVSCFLITSRHTPSQHAPVMGFSLGLLGHRNDSLIVTESCTAVDHLFVFILQRTKSALSGFACWPCLKGCGSARIVVSQHRVAVAACEMRVPVFPN
eukprot:4134023-Amphidinium_carterae.1